MAISTTQSIWRSGGGDNTRTAYCGSGVMAAQFYIADASVASSTRVKNKLNGQDLILPAGAVVLSVAINDAGAGSVDLGTLGVTSGAASAASIASNISVAALGTVTAGLTNTAISSLSYVTVVIDTLGSGTVGGYITYFVSDPQVGQQND